MAITPADIEQQTFSPSKHGYDTEEVDAFLEQLSAEVDAMLQKIADLKGRLNNTESQLAASQAQVASLEDRLADAASAPAATVVAPAPAPAPEPVDTLQASERQISQVLIVAQQSADKLVADARANAESIRNDADQKAREVIRQALAEKQNELDEIDRLKSSREEFRAEYKKLLQHFMDDAESVFPAQGLGTGLSGSKGTTHNDVTSDIASVAASAPVAAPAPVTVPAQGTVSGLGDFGDLD
ncbi:DivIVA domain-containing protein [Olsenella uli]|uniref:DivIVA domain-containing protein n=1 Tax=Olsenella uli TaxID=133926 RepID=UPI003D79B434